MSQESKQAETPETKRVNTMRELQLKQTLVDTLESIIKEAVGPANNFVVFEHGIEADLNVFLSNFEILHRVFQKNVSFNLSIQGEFGCTFAKEVKDVREYSEQAAVFFLDHCTRGTLQGNLRSQNGTNRMTFEEVTTLLQRKCQGESPLLDLMSDLGNDLCRQKLDNSASVVHWNNRVEYLGEYMAVTLARYVNQNREAVVQAEQTEFGTTPTVAQTIKSEQEIVAERLLLWVGEREVLDADVNVGEWPTKAGDIGEMDAQATPEEMKAHMADMQRLLDYKEAASSIKAEVRKEVAEALTKERTPTSQRQHDESITLTQRRDAVVFLAGACLYTLVKTPPGDPWAVNDTPELTAEGWKWLYQKCTPRSFRWIYGPTGAPRVSHHTAWAKIIIQIVERNKRLGRQPTKKKTPLSVEEKLSPSKKKGGKSRTLLRGVGPFGVDKHYIKSDAVNRRYRELGAQQKLSYQLVLLRDDAHKQLQAKPNDGLVKEALAGYDRMLNQKGINTNLRWEATTSLGSHTRPSYVNPGGGRSKSQSSFTANRKSGRRSESGRGGPDRNRSNSRGRERYGRTGVRGGQGGGRDSRTHPDRRRGGRSGASDGSIGSISRRASPRNVEPVDYSADGSRLASGYVAQGTLHTTTTSLLPTTTSPTDARLKRRLLVEDTNKHRLTPTERKLDIRDEKRPNANNPPTQTVTYDLQTDADISQTDSDCSYHDYTSGYGGSQTEDDEG